MLILHGFIKQNLERGSLFGIWLLKSKIKLVSQVTSNKQFPIAYTPIKLNTSYSQNVRETSGTILYTLSLSDVIHFSK